MKSRYILALLPTCLLSAGLHAELVVEDAWVRALPPGVPNASAYMTLRNTGAADVVLTGASSPIAASVQLHATMDHGGMLHTEWRPCMLEYAAAQSG